MSQVSIKPYIVFDEQNHFGFISNRLLQGIIYIMHTRGTDGVIVPRYIGKSENRGQEFGRWGDNYAYHIGDLSSVVFPGHEVSVQPLKYRLWAEALFETINSDRPRLRQTVFLWVRAWQKHDVSVWQGFGPTRTRVSSIGTTAQTREAKEEQRFRAEHVAAISAPSIRQRKAKPD